MTQLTDRGNAMGDLLSEYAEFIDLGTINYLIDLMSKEEKKSKREIFKELGISRGALYQPHIGNKLKQKIIKEAFKRLDSSIVIKTLYGRMKNLFINFIVDILSVTADEINTNNDLVEFIREIVTENAGLLKDVRDVERRKIIEIVTNKFSLEYNKINTNNDLVEFIREIVTENAGLLKDVRDVETNKFSLEYNNIIKLFWLTDPRYIYGDEIINSKTIEDQSVTPTVSIQYPLSINNQFTQRSRKKMPNESAPLVRVP
jgi:cell division protein FtsL